MLIPDLSNSLSFLFCKNTCKMAKNHHLLFHSSQNISSAPLQIIHSNVWGLSLALSNQGLKYYGSFIDDYSRFVGFSPCDSNQK